MKRTLVLVTSIIILMVLMSACSEQVSNNMEESSSGPSMMNSLNTENGEMGMGMEIGGMMRFHMATIPAPYKNMTSSIPSDNDSIERGQLIYTNNCAICHGDGGMGDGPAGVSLDPTPAKIAHTSQMMSDDYLYWRISEGGVEFETSMISFKDILSENGRWDVINYVRALGSGQVLPQENFGGDSNSPEAQATQQAEMLEMAIELDIISEDEAQFFAKIHPTVDGFMEENRGIFDSGETSMMESGLAAMVEEGLVTQEETNQFSRIHNLLLNANLMD